MLPAARLHTRQRQISRRHFTPCRGMPHYPVWLMRRILMVISLIHSSPLIQALVALLLVTTTEGGSANGYSAGNGYFNGGTATLPATAGGYAGGAYTENDVLAVVCWTGTAATLSAAVLAGDDIGIFTFVNHIGPGGTSPQVPSLNGWPTTLSPANSANDGYPELLLSPVPEPTTLALAGLGGLSLMLIRRRK